MLIARAQGTEPLFSDDGRFTRKAECVGCRDLIVDALLGTGAHHEVRDPIKFAIQAINRSGVPVVSFATRSGSASCARVISTPSQTPSPIAHSACPGSTIEPCRKTGAVTAAFTARGLAIQRAGEGERRVDERCPDGPREQVRVRYAIALDRSAQQADNSVLA